MNTVIARLTISSLLGRKRVFALAIMPLLLLGLTVLVRALVGVDAEFATTVTIVLGVGTLTPLIGLIAGTGSIGPEIGDGSIVYILAKPIPRRTIVLTKLVVAIGTAIMIGVVPIYVAGWILTGSAGAAALAPAVAALTASVAYCAIFLLLAIITRNAVVIGLLYALVWETVVGQFIPGARALSVQQWSLSIAERVLGDSSALTDLDVAVEFNTGVVMLVVVAICATWLATFRMRRLRLNADE